MHFTESGIIDTLGFNVEEGLIRVAIRRCQEGAPYEQDQGILYHNSVHLTRMLALQLVLEYYA